MAHGVAVIVPDYPAMAPIVRDGPCGWTISEVRPELVKAAILEACSSGEAGARGARGRERYLRSFAWDKQAAKFLSIVLGLGGPSVRERESPDLRTVILDGEPGVRRRCRRFLHLPETCLSLPGPQSASTLATPTPRPTPPCVTADLQGAV